MLLRSLIFTAAAAAIATPMLPAMADGSYPAAIKQMHTDQGDLLADAKGMTLYIFDKDMPGTSNCNGGCAEKWPPLMATPDSGAEGDFSIVTRADGSHQWAYKEMPLYTWFKDQKPGEATGDGVKGVWHVIKVQSGSSY